MARWTVDSVYISGGKPVTVEATSGDRAIVTALGHIEVYDIQFIDYSPTCTVAVKRLSREPIARAFLETREEPTRCT